MTRPGQLLQPPTIVTAMPGTGLPTWEIDSLRIVNGHCIDSWGREWTVAGMPDGEKGWTNSPGVRTNRSDRVDAEGSWRSRPYRKERLITLSGTVHCPTPELRELTEIELAALCSEEETLYTYRRRTESYDLCAHVELDEEPLIDPVTLTQLRWSFRFAAPDPRKHDFQWQEPRADPPQVNLPVSGLDDSGGGLSDAGGGLSDMGEAVPGHDARPAVVGNYGTAPARPFFILRGPLPRPRIVRVETGESIASLIDIEIGETVYVNCDQFPARNVPAQMVWSDRQGDLTSLWTVGVNWPEVVARDVATFHLDSSGARESLTVALRSAYR